MQTLKFLNELLSGGLYPKEALESLQDKMGIKFNIYPEYGLVVLNYDQIRSDEYKFTTIVKECRSLVLSLPTVKFTTDGKYVTDEGFDVVSRSFDRFFNLNEEVGKSYNIENMTAYEKLDGSLVMLFHHKGRWLYRTRSMIMPTDKVNGFEVTWNEIIEDALGNTDISSVIGDDSKNFTYIFELTSPENRVVTRYDKRKATLLAIRENKSGRYLPSPSVDHLSLELGYNRPTSFNFRTWSEIRHSVESLPNLEEGYVLYGVDGVPRVKVKSPAYLVAHRLRGEGLNPKRCMDLVIIGETEEYLSVFPEDRDRILPYSSAYNLMFETVNQLWDIVSHIDNQKEFAMMIKHTPVSSLLFSLKKGLTLDEAWNNLNTRAKYNMISAYL